MVRLAGRQGAVYLQIASGGVPTSVPFVAQWTLGASSDRIDVTAFGDPNKVYVAGLPDASGTFVGFYDDATAQTFTAALDGLPRGMYLYPNRNTPGQYWYGTVFVDFNIDVSVSDAVKLNSSWSAASAITKIG